MRARLNTTHKVLIAVVAAITFLLLLAVAVWAYDDAQKDEIAPGVKVGGVDIGGRSADSARKLIQREVVAPLRQPIVVSYEDHDYILSPKALKTKADVDSMVQEALDKSRGGDIFTRVTRYAGGSNVNVDLDPDIGYSKRAVGNFVNALSEQIDQSPEDATVYPDGSKLRPVPGKPGLGVEKDQLREEINDAAHSPGRDQTLQVPVASTKPEITKKDLPHEFPRYIFIDRSNFTLRFFHHLKIEKSYTIAVGQQGLETPAGLYHATDKQVDPSWHVPNSAWAGDLAGQVIPPGPADPLKARWIGIIDGAGIHGTDDIGSLGSAASHGCVRMSIPDVEDLYDRVDVGDPIYVK